MPKLRSLSFSTSFPLAFLAQPCGALIRMVTNQSIRRKLAKACLTDCAIDDHIKSHQAKQQQSATLYLTDRAPRSSQGDREGRLKMTKLKQKEAL